MYTSIDSSPAASIEKVAKEIRRHRATVRDYLRKFMRVLKTALGAWKGQRTLHRFPHRAGANKCSREEHDDGKG